MIKKRSFLLSFCAGILFASVLYCSILYGIVPLLNTEGWLKDVLSEKKKIAEMTPSPKIIILSGSNAFWGMRSEVIQEKCGMPTVNCAFHAGFSLAFYKDLLINSLKSGDIVVMPLEIGHYEMESAWNSTSLPAVLGWGKSFFSEYQFPFYEPALFYGFSFCSDGMFFQKVINMLLHGGKNKAKNVPDKSDSTITHEMVYNVKNMNQYGDIINTYNKEITLKGSLIPKNKKQFPSAYFLKEFHDLQHFIDSRGAKLIITWPVLCTEDSMEELHMIQELCADAGITIYGDPKVFMYSPEDFSDTYYHLKSSFAEQRSEKLADLLNTIRK